MILDLTTIKQMVNISFYNVQTPPTKDEVFKRVTDLLGMPGLCGIPDDLTSEAKTDVLETVAKEYMAKSGITMEIASVLETPYTPWLPNKRADIDPFYWKRYEEFLIKDFNNDVMSKFDQVTDKITGYLQDPDDQGEWERRGMVVGFVQSGKTSNYTGVINKAADAGYKLIVIVAGIPNNLRNQTQKRIDEGFIGIDTGKKYSLGAGDNKIGVGLINPDRTPGHFTTSVKDFTKQGADTAGIPLQNMKEPVILTVKKNSSILKNLVEWLKAYNANIGTKTIAEPMLLIDDEADNASINTKFGQNEISRINGQIRELLQLFDRRCYVGYTATPFANIFIDPNSDKEGFGYDLFPEHFIVSLEPPSNYVGPGKLFGGDLSDSVKAVDDNEDHIPLKHKKDLPVLGIPESLRHAIRHFVLSRAVRILRGDYSAHSSMLVNVSVYNAVQDQIRDVVHRELRNIRDSIQVNGSLAVDEGLKDTQINLLYETWLEEFSDSDYTWYDIYPLLNQAVSPISVVKINSTSTDSLNYDDHKENGLHVIAVGGYSLSRGLTLEGLTVSYFLRRSLMSDTLMQMGRWFGYRDGYDDLIRVWMPQESIDWYEHITESISELRYEFKQMEAAGAIPRDFGLRVRSHPDQLMITSRNKMGSAQQVTVAVGLSKRFIETHIVKRDMKSIELNRLAARRLVESIEQSGGPISQKDYQGKGYLRKQVDVSLIKDFLRGYQNHSASMITETGPVLKYIEDREKTELSKWDVLFVSLQHPNQGYVDTETLGIKINCPLRTEATSVNNRLLDLKLSNKQRVSDRGIESVGLTDRQISACEAEYEQLKSDRIGIDYLYRINRERPLLVVHLLNVVSPGPKESVKASVPETPVISWGISFPGTGLEEKVTQYYVNHTWLQEQYGDDLDEEEGPDDNS